MRGEHLVYLRLRNECVRLRGWRLPKQWLRRGRPVGHAQRHLRCPALLLGRIGMLPEGVCVLGLDALGVGRGGLGRGGVEQLQLWRRAVGGARPPSDLGVGVGVEDVPVEDLAGRGVELRARKSCALPYGRFQKSREFTHHALCMTSVMAAAV